MTFETNFRAKEGFFAAQSGRRPSILVLLVGQDSFVVNFADPYKGDTTAFGGFHELAGL